MDEFVDIPGYPGYKANRLGEIKGMRGGILSPVSDEKGYKRICCWLEDGQIGQKVHRLVALTFIPNPDNLAQIDHIDQNKENNCVDNLRWINNRDNCARQARVVNAKCYRYRSDKKAWDVIYRIDGKQHSKRFKQEHDAQFYVALLKAIYPHSNL